MVLYLAELENNFFPRAEMWAKFVIFTQNLSKPNLPILNDDFRLRG